MNEGQSFFAGKLRYPELGNLWQLYKCALEGCSADRGHDTPGKTIAQNAMRIAKAALVEWDEEVARHKREIDKGREP